MKSARPWFVAVMVLYLALVVGVLIFVPVPWNVVGAVVITLMGLRFYMLIRKAAEIGRKRPLPAPPAPGQPPVHRQPPVN